MNLSTRGVWILDLSRLDLFFFFGATYLSSSFVFVSLLRKHIRRVVVVSVVVGVKPIKNLNYKNEKKNSRHGTALTSVIA